MIEVLKMPQFELIFLPSECEMYKDAYDTLTKCDLWDWLREFKPHANEGFMFASHPNLNKIIAALKEPDRVSGASFASDMRIMQLVATLGGWDAYLEAHKKKWPENRPVCFCRSKQGLSLGWCGVAGGGVPGCEY
jgi:hypothetical protein